MTQSKSTKFISSSGQEVGLKARPEILCFGIKFKKIDTIHCHVLFFWGRTARIKTPLKLRFKFLVP